jgi:hypothetical protein
METSHHANSFNFLLEILHILPFIYEEGELNCELNGFPSEMHCSSPTFCLKWTFTKKIFVFSNEFDVYLFISYLTTLSVVQTRYRVFILKAY